MYGGVAARYHRISFLLVGPPVDEQRPFLPDIRPHDDDDRFLAAGVGPLDDGPGGHDDRIARTEFVLLVVEHHLEGARVDEERLIEERVVMLLDGRPRVPAASRE